MERNKDIAGNQIQRMGEVLSKLPNPSSLTMDALNIIKEFKLDKRMIAKRSGIDYSRLRNILNSPKHKVSEEEVKQLNSAIVQLIKEVIDRISE